MNELEYLAGYGLAGDFGRFRAARPVACARGDRVVVRSHRGLEIASILRPASPRHAAFLPNTTLGPLLRRFTPEDAEAERDMLRRAGALFDRARELAVEQDMPLEILDAEVLLDGAHAVLHHLRRGECDVRPFVSTLSREFAVHLALADLSAPPAPAPEEGSACGSGGCGAEGGCGSCGSGGGCGSCSTAVAPPPAAHFAELREKMEARRKPLL